LTRCFPALAAIACVAFASTVSAAPGIENPCLGSGSGHFLCPNLRIAPPRDLYAEAGGGRVLLRATSDVRSRGRGPMELRGVRNGPRSMRVRQRIYQAGGGHLDLATDASLHFTDVGAYFGGQYWKVHQLARFELWSVDANRQLRNRVRIGPKLNYCLRDLERTRAGRRSPPSRHYPGCNQNPYRDGVTLGTSVGWSDIYPANYSKQWIAVKGLRGCFALVMRVDPQGLLFESNEGDNSSQRLVRLPFRGDIGC
jgi:hypothetical protein